MLVGTTAAFDSASPDPIGGLVVWRAVCALVVAVAVQVATNYANDLADGVRGTDDPAKRVGPVRLVGSGLATPSEVRRAMIVAFAMTAVAGAPLVLLVEPALVLVGIGAIAAGYFYTGGPRPYGYAGLGEVFVFVFFGLVAVVGSAYVQTERVDAVALAGGVGCGAFATALLIVNNLRDRRGDAEVGKVTLAVRLGDRRTRALYVVAVLVPFAVVPVIAGGGGRLGAVLAFAALAALRRPVEAVIGGADGSALLTVLADTGRAQLLYGVALAVGLLIPVGAT